MTQLGSTLHEFLRAFGEGYRIALVGGLAVSARTEPRFTRDVDLAIAVANDAEAEALIFRARSLRYHAEASVEQDRAGRLATARLRRGHDPLVDLMFASCGIEVEIAEAAESLIVFGEAVAVARVGHLIAMKLLSRDPKRRPRDEQDLVALRDVATEEDWALAVEAVAMIEGRGFGRGRDLGAALETLRQG